MKWPISFAWPPDKPHNPAETMCSTNISSDDQLLYSLHCRSGTNAIDGKRHEILILICALMKQLLNMDIPVQPVMFPLLILNIDNSIVQKL